jgi:hypothetical protein
MNMWKKNYAAKYICRIEINLLSTTIDITMSLQRKTPRHFEKLIIFIVFVPAKPKQTPQEWSMMEDSRICF